MRDLYALLGLPRSSSLGMIERELRNVQDAELRADIQAVLLDVTSREAYDQILKCMHRVGEVRAHLSELGEAEWSTGEYVSFVPIGSAANRLRDTTRSDYRGVLQDVASRSEPPGASWYPPNATSSAASRETDPAALVKVDVALRSSIVSVGESVAICVTVSRRAAAADRGIKFGRLPEVEGIEFGHWRGETGTFMTTDSRGRTVTSSRCSYLIEVTPAKPGRYMIPPVSLTVDGEVFVRPIDTMELEVREADRDGAWAGCIAFAVIAMVVVFLNDGGCATKFGGQPSSASRHSPSTQSGRTAPQTNGQARPSSSSSTITPKAEAPPMSLPATGVLIQHRTLGNKGPFRISTRADGNHFYVKIVRLPSKREEVVCFVRGGETINLELPLGSYELRYASGTVWRGPIARFGSRTIYSRADEVFKIRVEAGGRQISGYTVELYKQIGGNLETDRISESDF